MSWIPLIAGMEYLPPGEPRPSPPSGWQMIAIAAAVVAGAWLCLGGRR